MWFLYVTAIIIHLKISSNHVLHLIKQLRKYNELFPFQIVPESFWTEIRLNYVVLCELLLRIDESFGNIVLAACVIDLYFVCLQVLNITTYVSYNIIRSPWNQIMLLFQGFTISNQRMLFLVFNDLFGFQNFRHDSFLGMQNKV